MTREEAITFMDELKVCIKEHPIVADWLVEIADRKTEPQTSGTPYKIETSSVCKDEPQTCSVNSRPYSECSSCEHFKCTADEPQTERSK